MKSFLIACFALLLATPAAAQSETQPVPNMTQCLLAVQTLDQRYRDWMQIRCLSTAGDICIAQDNAEGTSCLSDLASETRAFTMSLLNSLPDEIEGNGFQARGYARSLQTARDMLENIPECVGMTGQDQTICEYIQLGTRLTELIYHARENGFPVN
ncbi:hypothetical protein [Nioella sediminis]|uniref:hypothetical protein n=1 Tax=Nioella sediminis TaxID=1912092 RepID=UPI0008FCFD38|nr:hypothetical protein [Nioella sediminis]TBX28675.1 hypothetical protein TK43_04200 [Roseovarius sp. JS7-11]